MDFSNYECNDQMSIFDMIRQPFKIDKPIRLIELFAGVGSQAMALRDIGASFEHHRVVEFDKFAIASYNAIHDTNFQTSDIRQFKGTDLGVIETDKYCYILTYSFPCQDLSVAGKQRGMTKGSGTRSGLLWEGERLLDEIENFPQVLLMENVPQVISDANIKDFQLWQDFLTSKGYSNYVEILNAKDFGVAQNRERCFMVSILGDYNYRFPKPIPLTKTMKDYLEDEVDEKFYINTEKAKGLIKKLIDGNQLQGCIGNVNPSGNGINGNVYSGDLAPTLTTNKGEGQKICLDVSQMGIEGKPRIYTNTMPILTARDYKDPRLIVEQIGNVSESNAWDNPQVGRVYSPNGLSPTLNTMQGGNKQPMIVASRGRNPGNPSDRTPGNYVEQRLEVNSQGICNTITSVQKDNLVLENCIDMYNERLRDDKCCGTITANGNVSFTHCGTFGVVEKIGIKQATSKGYEECIVGGVADLSFPSSKTRRGRVQDGGNTCPTLTAETTGVCRIESQYRIRKLIPLECWRLMDFTDEDFYKAESVNSNSQLYKQAGNSIVKAVLMAIFKQML